MSIEWIEHQGKKILYANYSGIKNGEEIIRMLDLQQKMILASPEPVLILVNVENSVMTAEAMAYSKEQLTKLNLKIKKIGAVGVSGLKSILAKGINAYLGKANQEFFSSVENAKEWLVK
jgi:hypothetical protein